MSKKRNAETFAPYIFEYTKCVLCRAPFTDKNVHSDAGWRETKISGMCEDCFDAITKEPDEEPNDGEE